MTEQPETGTRPPGRSPWHISRIPGHLGRARTSTVVLAVLFVAIFALYLYIKPDTPGATTTGTSSQVPAATTAPAPGTTVPTTTAEPTQDQPTTSDTATPTDVPTETSTPDVPTDSTAPSTTATLPTPTLSSPAG